MALEGVMTDVLPESSPKQEPTFTQTSCTARCHARQMTSSAHHCKGMIMLRSIGSVTFLALLMVGCGGGDSAPPPPATYTVGGTVTGLSGTGLVLNSDFGGDLAVSASGSFTFSTPLRDGSAFNVGVKIQPTSPAQYCQVANSTGTIAAANVMNVTVTCRTGYTVGGTVSGLVGSGLTLATCTPVRQHFGSVFPPYCPRPLQVGANGAFTLDSAYPAGYLGPDYVLHYPAAFFTDAELRNQYRDDQHSKRQ